MKEINALHNRQSDFYTAIATLARATLALPPLLHGFRPAREKYVVFMVDRRQEHALASASVANWATTYRAICNHG